MIINIIVNILIVTVSLYNVQLLTDHVIVYCRIKTLEIELASRRALDHEETAHLEKAMEQVESNLERSTVWFRDCNIEY